MRAAIGNADVAAAFEEMGELLSIQAASPFRIRAYARAAERIRALPQPLAESGSLEALTALPGIGRDLAAKILELLQTGKLEALERLRGQVPAGLRQLLRLPGLGPTRVRLLHRQLKVRNLADLIAALKSKRVASLHGFGEVLQAKLLQAIAQQHSGETRWPWRQAHASAEALREYLAAIPGVQGVAVAGSLRRGRDAVGDLDLLVCSLARIDLGAHLRAYQDTERLLASGRTRCSGVLRNGIPVDLRLIRHRARGAALQYLTGSRAHSVQLRRRAQEVGLKLNEYGLFRGARSIAGVDEQGIYAALDLPWIAPELREDRGELQAAAEHRLPALLTRAALRGDLHVHTDASDGHQGLEAMVGAAQRAGLAYVAITDHAAHLGIYHGLDARRIERQIESVHALRERLEGIEVLTGVEVDVLADGRLAVPDAVLAKLDVVIIAVHDHFDLSEQQQTTRLLRALERPHVSILAHPTGRLIGERPGYRFDTERVLEAAQARPCYIELNAQPLRLDADDVLCRACRDRGVLVSVASDAHAPEDFAFLDDGVRQARRGWLSAADVLNARPIRELRALLARTHR